MRVRRCDISLYLSVGTPSILRNTSNSNISFCVCFRFTRLASISYNDSEYLLDKANITSRCILANTLLFNIICSASSLNLYFIQPSSLIALSMRDKKVNVRLYFSPPSSTTVLMIVAINLSTLSSKRSKFLSIAVISLLCILCSFPSPISLHAFASISLNKRLSCSLSGVNSTMSINSLGLTNE